MINSINAYQYPYCNIPTAGTVNIQIFNPQACSDGFVRCSAQNQMMAPIIYPQPVFLNYGPWAQPVILPPDSLRGQYSDEVLNQNSNISDKKTLGQPQNEFEGQTVNQVASQSVNQFPDNGLNRVVNQSLNQNYANGQFVQYPQNISNNLTKKSDKEVTPVSTQNKEKVQEGQKSKVRLTDEYIMTLEDYLNNQNPKIRLMAARDVLERFKEDKTRKNDIALTALLNKIIQDPVDAVRFIGLTTLDLGYAGGDDLTVQILKNMQKSVTNNAYGEDPLLASQILLRLSSEQQS